MAKSIHPLEPTDKLLIIGCGHKFLTTCEQSHPKSQFETVDKESKANPDIQADALKREDIGSKLIKSYPAIIYEHFPPRLHSSLTFLKDFVQKNGHIVYVGFNLVDTFSILDKSNAEIKTILVGYNHNRNVIIIPAHLDANNNNSSPLPENAPLQKYLGQYLDSNNIGKCIYEVQITPALTEKTNRLRGLIYTDSHHTLWPLLNSFTNGALLKPSETPLTLKVLIDFCKEYKPGFFREHTKPTKGMAELKSFITHLSKTKNESAELSASETIDLLRIIATRQSRSSINLNPTRQKFGSTYDVFQKIAESAIAYLISDKIYKEDLMQIKPDARISPRV